jgi:hypothetical protein
MAITASSSQHFFPTLRPLINNADPCLPLIREWIAGAGLPVELLLEEPRPFWCQGNGPVSVEELQQSSSQSISTQLPSEGYCTRFSEAGAKALLSLGVTTRSPMGSLALETGGLLIDHGWLRVFGSGGHPRLPLTVQQATGLWFPSPPQPQLTTCQPGGPVPSPQPPDRLIIAEDVVGGAFALHAKDRQVHYFAPDSLEWEELGLGYTDFLQWAMDGGNLATFYQDVRWPGWEGDCETLDGALLFHFHPPLWAAAPTGVPTSVAEGPGSGSGLPRSRRAVSRTEVVALNMLALLQQTDVSQA